MGDIRNYLNPKVYFFLIFFAQIIAMTLVLISIFIVDFTTYIYPEDGSYGISVYPPSGISYKEYQDSACNKTSLVEPYPTYDTSECKFYQGLYNGEIVYLVFSTISLISTFDWLIAGLVYLFHKNFFYVTIVLGLIPILSQTIALSSYSKFANVQFLNCSSDYTESDQPPLCASDGIKLSIAAIILYALNSAMFYFFGKKFNKIVENQDADYQINSQHGNTELNISSIAIR